LKTDKHILPVNGIAVKDEKFVLKNTFTDYSNEIEEIISNKPPLIVRWGTLIFFFLVLILGVMSWFIRYPDIVTSKAKLTSLNAPKPVICRNDGSLIELAVKEGDSIQVGGIIGIIESTSNAQEVLALSASLDTLSALFSKNNRTISPNYMIRPYNSLGELQQAYQAFSNAFNEFKKYLPGGFWEKKKLILGSDLSDIKRLNYHLYQRKAFTLQDLGLSEKTFQMNEILKKDNVISDLEYRNEKSKLTAKQMSIPQINEAIIINETRINEKRQEIIELENAAAEQPLAFQQALNTFRSAIDQWKQNYVLVAPVSGRVNLAGFLQKNQQLKAGQTVCFISQGNSEYFAEIFIPQENFGKVKKGEKVLLKFFSYPSHEFGSVTGELDFVSAVPTDTGYLARIIFPYGLKTNYNKEIQYKEGLTAKAEIVTNNMRLLERLYYNFKKQVDQ